MTEHRKKDATEKLAHNMGHAGLDEFVSYLRSPWRIIWTNLLAGIFRGLGFLLGATVVLAILVFVLVQVLGNLPWVGEFFQQAGSFVQDIQQAGEALSEIGR